MDQGHGVFFCPERRARQQAAQHALPNSYDLLTTLTTPKTPHPATSSPLGVVLGVGVVAGVAVLVVGGGGRVADAGGLGVVALADLIRVGVGGEGVRGRGGGSLVAAEAEEAALLGAVARGVVVGRRGAEALLLPTLAGEEDLGQGGEDEEDTGVDVLVMGVWLFSVNAVCGVCTYMATMDTASIADSMRQAVLYEGTGTLPSTGVLMSAAALPVPKTVLTLEPWQVLAPFL